MKFAGRVAVAVITRIPDKEGKPLISVEKYKIPV